MRLSCRAIFFLEVLLSIWVLQRGGGGEGGEGGPVLRPTPILKSTEVASGEAGPSHISLGGLPPPGEIVIEEGSRDVGEESVGDANGQEGGEGNRRGAEERGEARLIEGGASAGGGEVKRVGWKWPGWGKSSCDDPEEAGDMLKKGLALAVAYSANIGGIATLTGTMPNLVYAGQLPTLFPSAEPTSFSLWFSYCFPISLCMLAANVAILFFMYCPPPARGSKGFHSGQLMVGTWGLWGLGCGFVRPRVFFPCLLQYSLTVSNVLHHCEPSSPSDKQKTDDKILDLNPAIRYRHAFG